MKFPYKICKLTNNEVNIFNKYFATKGEFVFEGIWFRSQEEVNKNVSGYIDNTTRNRRTIHYNHVFYVKDNYLMVKSSYIYLSIRLNNNEYDKYLNDIINTLENNNYIKNNNIYIKDNLNIMINKYDKHPYDEIIDNYKTVDIVVKSDNLNNTDKLFNQVWNLQVKGIRERDTRGNPKYINDFNELKEYFPMAVELGCGPSIEAGVMPLYKLHEIYKVQRHSDGKFYFGTSDTLIKQIIEKDNVKFDEFYEIIAECIKAKPTNFHYNLKKMYDKKLFTMNLFNNNFDRLCKRIGINENILRVYKIENYFPKVIFDKDVKALLCIGTHADRRFIQRQARNQGLKIIYVDPEGFNTDNEFFKYEIEGAKDEDYILKMTASEFSQVLENILNEEDVK
jgi:hypothetical protein